MEKDAEKAQGIVEFHIGDCSCEQDRACTSCKMRSDIAEALAQARSEGYEKGREDVKGEEYNRAKIHALLDAGYHYEQGWNEAIAEAVKVAKNMADNDFRCICGLRIAEKLSALKKGQENAKQ